MPQVRRSWLFPKPDGEEGAVQAEDGMTPVLKNIARTLLVVILLLSILVAYKTVKWKAYVWLPDYVRYTLDRGDRLDREPPRADTPTHVIFLFVDHYEPGSGEKGAERNREWLSSYRAMADRHSDSYGRRPQHTWFYAYEQKNVEVMTELARVAFEGYGEVEMHWHHGDDTNASFASKLEAALDWFASFGAMTPARGDTVREFGFVHGNWALDNSGRPEHCGVSRELDILREAGCYADFTFPSFGSVSQPSKTNSIYYSRDTDDSKSYDTGDDATVGRSHDNALLIFQGPLALVARRQLFEYGDVADDYPPSPERVDTWVRARVSVKGRPEWVFVKIYTHGIQNRGAVLSEEMDAAFSHLEEKYGTGRYRLHYVTAREAVNIVRAAEDGLSGNPDLYRDYEIGKPLNTVTQDLSLHLLTE
jgi:hypothetical protein